jgi:hypothetical protein
MVARSVRRLGVLSDAEMRVLAELDTGEPVVLGEGVPAADAEARRVRAALIRILLLGDDPKQKYRLHEAGLQISGAWIPDCLDLVGCRGLGDLWLIDCCLGSAPRLHSAEVRNLHFDGSRLPGLSADRIETRGDMFLLGGRATGEVRLLGAKLGGTSTAPAPTSVQE